MKNLGTISVSRLERIDRLSPERKRQFYMAHSSATLELNKMKAQEHGKSTESMRLIARERFQEVFRLLDRLEWEELAGMGGRDEI